MLETMFRLYSAIDTSRAATLPDEACDAIVGAQIVLEEQITAVPVETLSDLIVKVDTLSVMLRHMRESAPFGYVPADNLVARIQADFAALS